MSVIIRLQNLPWSANSLDIRHYFNGLSIPEGGVHIVGGEMGDAFIAFSTDEDARQAMMLGGGKIKEVQITLRLSSRSEMQKVIEAARQASMSNSLAQLLAPTVPAVPAVPLISLAQQGALLPRRDSREEKKDSSDISSSSHDGSRRDRKDKSRSRSRDRDRSRRDRRDKDRDRDRDRDRRRRSRTRSRSRDRRRRRSRSRSRGRDRKDSKEEMKKDKEPIIISNPSVVPTTLPNLSLLNTTAWATAVTAVPPVLAQATPIFDKLANLGLLRNLASQASGIPTAQLSLSTPPQIITENSLSPRKDNNFQNRNDFSIGTRRGDSRERNQNNRGIFQRDSDQDNRNSRNFDENSQGSFQRFGNDDRFNQNRQNFNRQNNNKSGFQRNNEQGNTRFGNFDNFSNQGGNRGGRSLLDFPNQREGRFNNRTGRNEQVDEFGRSLQLRNRRNTTDESAGEEEENFQGRQPQNFPFQTRFLPQNQQPTPPPLLPSRESWPPGRNQRNENFQDRRNFRNDNFYDNRFRGKNDFKVDNRQNFNGNGDNGPKLSQENDCCVEIRGLPTNMAYGDVRRPFSSQKIIVQDIKFFDYSDADKKCRVKFLNFEHKMKALQNNNKILFDGKPLPLLHISYADFDECKNEGVKRPEAKFSDDEEEVVAPEETCIQIKDIPSSATETDVENLFQGSSLDKIALESTPDKKNKTAYIQFSKAIDARVALNTQNRQIGSESVILLPLSLDQFKEKCESIGSNKLEVENGMDDIINENSQESMDENKNHNSPLSGSDCILIKNLPFEANDRDICDFFSDIGLVPTRIHLMLDVNNQPSGDAFCEFPHTEQALKACTKNGSPMGKNILSLEQIPRSEMLEALGVETEPRPTDPVAQPSHGQMQARPFPLSGPPGPNNGFGRPQCVVALENVPFRATSFDIVKFFGWSYKLTEDDIMRRFNERGQQTGDARVCFKSPEDAMKAVRFMNNKSLNGRPIRMKIL